MIFEDAEAWFSNLILLAPEKKQFVTFSKEMAAAIGYELGAMGYEWGHRCGCV